jgi:hypothetical protein
MMYVAFDAQFSIHNQVLTRLQGTTYAVEVSLFLQKYIAAVISMGGCKIDIFCCMCVFA